jgi:hypothetical protein
VRVRTAPLLRREGIMPRIAVITIVVSICWGLAMAQDEAPSAAAERLQNCVVDAPLPEEPAAAVQGGFQFEYQSFRGVTDDDRVCTVYRLRNTADKPPTPFRWMLADEPVVEKARLGRCDGSSDTCPWMTFVKYFAGAIDTNLSTLSYGLNADAFHEQATTYLSHASIDASARAEESGTTASSVGTEIAGTFESVDGSDVAVHAVVKSRFEPDPDGGFVLVYEIEDLAGSGAVGSGALRFAWDAFAAVEPVADLLARAGDTGPADVAVEGVGTLVRTANALTISVPADAFTLEERFLFHVSEPGGQEPVVTVSMAAYVPASAGR